MGRTLSGSDTGGAARRKTMLFTASKPSIIIPPWARGGIMELWGCGAGGNSGVNSSSGNTGAVASGVRIVVPPNAVAASVSVGAGPPPGSYNENFSGGATTLSIDGVEYLWLGGGAGNGSGGAPVRIGGGTMILSGGGSGTGSPSPDVVLAMALMAVTRASAYAGKVAPGLGIGSPSTVGPSTEGTSLFGARGVGHGFGGNLSQKAGDGFLFVEFIEGAAP